MVSKGKRGVRSQLSFSKKHIGVGSYSFIFSYLKHIMGGDTDDNDWVQFRELEATPPTVNAFLRTARSTPYPRAYVATFRFFRGGKAVEWACGRAAVAGQKQDPSFAVNHINRWCLLRSFCRGGRAAAGRPGQGAGRGLATRTIDIISVHFFSSSSRAKVDFPLSLSYT